MAPIKEQIIFRTQVLIRKDSHAPFSDWQARYHIEIVKFEGFISLEISSIFRTKENLLNNSQWEITQRFDTMEHLNNWRDSAIRNHLLIELSPLLEGDKSLALVESTSQIPHPKEGVTEVIVTEIKPECEAQFREWIAKMHKIESEFPGFQKVYIQSPVSEKGDSWITLLQFDTIQHLDQWLISEERAKILKEGGVFLRKMESHRIISSFAGWFANRPTLLGMPPVWKQTMLILLGLFPIVMVELKYLSPLTAGLDLSVGTFIGNAISVSLISWPIMPILIYLLSWWLTPQGARSAMITFWGTCVVLICYFIEIVFFFKFL